MKAGPRPGGADPRLLGAALRIGLPECVSHVEGAMHASGGAVAGAARALGVSRGTLLRWLSLPALAHVRRIDRAEAARRAAKKRLADRKRS